MPIPHQTIVKNTKLGYIGITIGDSVKMGSRFYCRIQDPNYGIATRQAAENDLEVIRPATDEELKQVIIESNYSTKIANSQLPPRTEDFVLELYPKISQKIIEPDPEQKLSEEEKEIISSWSADFPYDIEFIEMRNPNSTSGRNFINILKKLPDYKGIVYRGTKMTSDELKYFEKNKRFQLKLTSSFSKNKLAALNYMEGMFDTTTNIPNHKVLIIAQVKKGKYINEILMEMRGFSETVKKIIDANPNKIEEVVVIGNTNFNCLDMIFTKKYSTLFIKEI